MLITIYYIFNTKRYQCVFRSKKILTNLLLCVFLMVSNSALSEVISGSVKDAKTNESIPFANVILKNSTLGTMSGNDGCFKLDIDQFPCTIIVKFIGYKTKEVEITSADQILTILLETDVYSLNEVTVKPDNSYERSLLKKIIKNRKYNNPDNITPINFDDYTRTTVFLSNIQKKTTQSKAFKNSTDAFILKNDSSYMMPFFFNETLTKHVRDKQNNIDQSEEVAVVSDGILPQVNKQINFVLNNRMTTEFNFYNNQIVVMTRGFPSPVSNTALLYYNIYLCDSITTDNKKHYKFNFFPKSYKNITFKGHFWVEEGSWALTEIKAELPNSANLNFVKDFRVFVNYEKYNEKKWFYKTQKINLNLVLSKKEGNKRTKKSFDVQRIICYRDASLKKQMPAQKLPANTSVDKSAIYNQQIVKYREELAPFDSLEHSAYSGITQLKDNKFIKVVDKFSAMTLNGYYNLGKLDLGPYFSFYRRNEIEGDRFSIPLRTSEKLFRNFMLGGYLGYGTKNNEFAYGGTMKYLLPNKKRSVISTHFHYDYFDLTKNKFIEFIRENPFQQGGGNIISSFTSSVPNPYVMRNRYFDIGFEYQVNENIGILIRPSLNRYYSNRNIIFKTTENNLPHIDTRNVMLDFRFSFDQNYDEGFFSRIYYGNQSPVFHVSTLLGQYVLPKVSRNKTGYYANINFSMKHRYNMGPMFLKTLIEGGGILGNVPYPLLYLPRGTQDIGVARYHFNLLHHTSFSSDLYLSTHFTLNGGGILFNKLPVINKLNLREILSLKAFYGKLHGHHSNVLEIPNFIQAPLSEPYMEIGFGITNIFKCVRVDYVNRINKGQKYNNFSSSHGFRVRIEVSF